jgi:hypothetical protein
VGIAGTSPARTVALDGWCLTTLGVVYLAVFEEVRPLLAA